MWCFISFTIGFMVCCNNKKCKLTDEKPKMQLLASIKCLSVSLSLTSYILVFNKLQWKYNWYISTLYLGSNNQRCPLIETAMLKYQSKIHFSQSLYGTGRWYQLFKYVSLLKVIYNEMEINLIQNNGNINDLK